MGKKTRQDLAIRVAALARRQNGNVSAGQLLELGMSRWLIAEWVRLGRLFRVYRGVFAVGRMPTTRVERASAAVMACGAAALLSHGGALALWGAGDRWPSTWEVMVAAGNPRPQGIRVHRCPGLAAADRTCQLGVPVTSLARAVLDCARRTPADRLGRLVNDALVSPYLTEERLQEAMARYPLHPGVKLVRPHVEEGLTRSGLEDMFVAFCRVYRLPRPEMNATVDGREVDALFRAENVIVELDSWRYHRHKPSFRTDRLKDAEALAKGLVTVRITDDRMSGPRAAEEAERLHTILENRSHVSGPDGVQSER